MRGTSLFGLIATLLAIGASTSVQAAGPDWPKSLTLVTASPGGVYYIYGDELARILTEKLGVTVNPLPTQGPVHNVKLIDSGGAQLGMTTMGVALHGWNGTGDWTGGKSFRSMRALFPMYDTPFQAVVLRRSGIATLAQLDKKRLGIGPRAGTGGTYIPTILKILGISADRLWIIRRRGHRASCRSLRRHRDADRGACAGGPGGRGEGAGHILQSLRRAD